jgi:hypothetical protein
MLPLVTQQQHPLQFEQNSVLAEKPQVFVVLVFFKEAIFLSCCPSPAALKNKTPVNRQLLVPPPTPLHPRSPCASASSRSTQKTEQATWTLLKSMLAESLISVH